MADFCFVSIVAKAQRSKDLNGERFERSPKLWRHFSCLVAKFIQLMPVYLSRLFIAGRAQQWSEKQVQVQELLGDWQRPQIQFVGRTNPVPKFGCMRYPRGEISCDGLIAETKLDDDDDDFKPLQLFKSRKSLKSISKFFVFRQRFVLYRDHHSTAEAFLIKLCSHYGGLL